MRDHILVLMQFSPFTSAVTDFAERPSHINYEIANGSYRQYPYSAPNNDDGFILFDTS